MTSTNLSVQSDGHKLRVVVLSYESHQSCAIVRELIDTDLVEPIAFVRSVVVDPRRRGLALVRFLSSPTRREGAAWKVVEVLLARVGDIVSVARRLPRTTLKSIARERGVPCFDCKDAADPALLHALEQLQPDLLLSVHFNQLLRPATWEVASLGAINVHGALLPNHRGLFPHFYAVAAGDPIGGVTVHWVDERFDTGPAVSRRTFPIHAKDTVVKVENRAIPAAVEALEEALKLIGELGRSARAEEPDEGPSIYHSWPTPADMKRLRNSGHRYLDFDDALALVLRR